MIVGECWVVGGGGGDCGGGGNIQMVLCQDKSAPPGLF